MKDYKKSKIVKLMLELNPETPPLTQGIAWWMLQMVIPPTEPAWGVGDTLVLGCDDNPFANVIGSEEFGFRPLGVCETGTGTFQQRFQQRRLRSYSRFISAPKPSMFLVNNPFKYIFVFPSYHWDSWKERVRNCAEINAWVIVAQNMPYPEPEAAESVYYLRQAGQKTCVLADKEKADVMVFWYNLNAEKVIECLGKING